MIVSGIAIITRIVPFQDYDAVLEFFTQRDGMVSVIAQGIRRSSSKNKGHCHLGAMVEYELFMPRGEQSLGKLKRLESLRGIPEYSLLETARIALACEVSSYFLSLDHEASGVFDIWKEFIESEAIPENRLIGFLCRLLKEEGIFPAFRGIVEQKTLFWHDKSGIMPSPSSDERYIQLSFPVLKAFGFASVSPLGQTEKIAFSASQRYEFWTVFWWVYSSHAAYFPRSKAVYESLMADQTQL